MMTMTTMKTMMMRMTNNEDILEELVDIHEVLDELLFQLDYSEGDLWEVRRLEAEQKGVFKDKEFFRECSDT